MAASTATIFRVLGLMSGTSCDGVTVAGAAMRGKPARPRVRCLGYLDVAYPKALRERLLRAAEPGRGSSEEVAALHVELARFWARAAARFAGGRAGLGRYDLVASHGHTLHHRPPSGRRAGFSLQIGDASTLSELTGLPVAYDFRSRDLALGGQGAPLVPRADEVFFGGAAEPRVTLNLGGIANIAVLPAGGAAGTDGAGVLAFDTGPGNMVMDSLARHATRGRASFDRYGRMAAAGRPDAALLARWLAHPFFALAPPRSTGREDFGETFLAPALRAVARHRLRWVDALATACLLTSYSVSSAVHAYAIPGTRRVIGAGGGMRNRHLIRELSELLRPMRLVPSGELGVPGPAREALAFALLGYFTWHGIPGNLPSATGARRAAVLGSLTPGWRNGNR